MEEEKVMISKHALDELIQTNCQYVEVIEQLQASIDEFNESEQEYAKQINKLTQVSTQQYQQLQQQQAKITAMNDVLIQRDQQLTLAQNQILYYNQQHPDAILPQSFQALHAVSYKSYSDLDISLLENELQKLRFQIQPKQNQSSTDFDNYLKQKIDELENCQKQLQDVKEQNSELQLQTQKLQVELKMNGQNQQQSTKIEVSALENRLKSTIEQLQSSQESFKLCKLEKEQLEAKIDLNNKQLQNFSNMQQFNNELQNDNIQLTNSLTQLQQQVQAMTLEIDVLQKQLQSAVNLKMENAIPKDEHTRIVKQTRESVEEQWQNEVDIICQLLQPNSQVKLTKENYKREIQEFTGQFNNLLIDLQKLAQKAQEDENQIQSFQDSQDELKKQLAQAKTDKDQLSTQLNEQKHLQQQQLVKIQAQEQELTSKQHEIIQLSHEQKQNITSIDKIHQLENEIGTVNKEREILYGQLKELDKSYSETQKQMFEEKQKVVSLEQANTAIIRENEKLKEIVEEVIKRLEEQEEINKVIGNEKMILEQKLSHTTVNQTKTVQEIESQQAQMKIQIDCQLKQIQELSTLKKQLDDQCLSLKQEAIRADAALQSKQMEIDQQGGKYTELKLQYAQQGQLLEQQKILIDRLRNEKEELQNDIQELREENNQFQLKNIQIDSELKNTTKNIDREEQYRQRQLNDLQLLVTQKNQQLTETEQKLNKAVEQFAVAQREVSILQQELQDQKNNVGQLNQSFMSGQQGATEKINQLNSQIMKQMDENSQTKAELQTTKIQFLKLQDDYKKLQMEFTEKSQLHNQLNNQVQILSSENAAMKEQIRMRETQYNQHQTLFQTQLEMTQTKQFDLKLNQEIQMRDQEIKELQMKYAKSQELLKEKEHEVKQLQEELRTYARKFDQTELTIQRVKENALEMKTIYEDRIKKLKAQVVEIKNQTLMEVDENKNNQFDLQNKMRTQYGQQISELVEKNKILQQQLDQYTMQCTDLKNEKEKLQMKYKDIKSTATQIDEKFKNAEKNAEKYKELYKKAYGVVEKHKERELQYRAAINDLENKLQQRIMQQPIQRVYSQYPDSRMNMQSYAPVPVPIRDDLDFDDLTHLK
ncbi:Conserved_hypothetical protein [Hexamita inflata]|uniref:Uncharacterized protein n=1 Tax=Hexamita inflata TaxID=28002 RepID=A0AA86R5Y0_9EUKA|nr:Conserved hypothetical protein [Hexamita inflata]